MAASFSRPGRYAISTTSGDATPERRCLVEAAEALVQCLEWNAETDEVDAFNCFGKLEHVAGRGRPRLEERLTRAQVREWVAEVAAPKLEGARATGESHQMD